MFRTTDIVLVAVMVSAAAFTYKTKHDAEAQLAELRRVETQIRLEQDSINVLKADWSLLTQPGRLQRLAEIYAEELELRPIEPSQIVSIEDVPMRPVELDDFSTKRLGGLAEADNSGGAKVIQ